MNWIYDELSILSPLLQRFRLPDKSHCFPLHDCSSPTQWSLTCTEPAQCWTSPSVASHVPAGDDTWSPSLCRILAAWARGLLAKWLTRFEDAWIHSFTQTQNWRYCRNKLKEEGREEVPWAQQNGWRKSHCPWWQPVKLIGLKEQKIWTNLLTNSKWDVFEGEAPTLLSAWGEQSSCFLFMANPFSTNIGWSLAEYWLLVWTFAQIFQFFFEI